MMDPQAEAVLKEMQAAAKPMPDSEEEWLRGYRAELEGVVAMQGRPPEIEVRHHAIPRADGTALGLRLYRPPADGLRPTFLWIHGGGFVAGSLEGYDIPLRCLAIRSGWQIVSVDYRLAPEHPFPAAPDDCRAALDSLFLDQAIEADPARIAVGGDSAGGLLATLTAIHARDGGRDLTCQMLLYPNTDLRQSSDHPSRGAFDGTVIRIAELYRSLALYLGDTNRSRPDVSPLLTPDLAGLCPVFLVSNAYDPLRDEAEAYAKRLAEAGVPTELWRMEGMIHTALQRAARIQAGDALITRMATVLQASAGRARS